jgi:hypothetical protein
MQARSRLRLARYLSLEISPEYQRFTDPGSVRLRMEMNFLLVSGGDVRFVSDCSRIKYRRERI